MTKEIEDFKYIKINTTQELEEFIEHYESKYNVEIKPRFSGYYKRGAFESDYNLPTIVRVPFRNALIERYRTEHLPVDKIDDNDPYNSWIEMSVPLKVYKSPEKYPEYYL
jgi:hypothetical protein